MLRLFSATSRGLKTLDGRGDGIPPGTTWVDLLEPTVDEEKRIEAALAIDVPTREEMSELETSARLYEDEGWLFMTATLVIKIDTANPRTSQVTFILGKDVLVTNRYADPVPFARFVSYAEKHPSACSSPGVLLNGLLEAVVDRLAELLEKIGAELDATSNEIFASNGSAPARRNFNRVLARVGSSGDVISKARESLVSLGRLLAFLHQASQLIMPEEPRAKSRTISRDVASLSDHASFLANKVTFLLDATLGMINIEQNNILKIFSVVTVMLLPPSLLAGIFGMNFHSMPLIARPQGFALTIGCMLISMLVPYLYFRLKGWL